jgi:hypothetical protein
MRKLAYAAARAGNLVQAIAWARAAVHALAGDRILADEARQQLAELLARHWGGAT